MNYTIDVKPLKEGKPQNNVFDWAGGEEMNTPKAAKRLTELLECGDTLDIVSVTKINLPPVTCGKRKVTGRTDLRVARKGWKHD